MIYTMGNNDLRDETIPTLVTSVWRLNNGVALRMQGRQCW